MNAISQIAKAHAERMEPGKTTVMERDPQKSYVERDEYGNEKTIQIGKEKQQLFDIEGSFKHNKTGTYWSYNKNKGIYEDSGIPFDRNEGKSGDDKSKPMDTYKFVKNIQNTRSEIDEIDSILNNTKPEEGYYTYNGKSVTGAELQAKKKAIETRLKGESDSMISYLEENRYPGITSLKNELWNHVKNVEVKDIASTIESKLKALNDFNELQPAQQQDLINSLTLYFKSRKY